MSRQRLTIKNAYGLPRWLTGDEDLVFEGDFEFEVEDLDAYVRVSFGPYSRHYTYRDPSRSLVVNDLVEVPTPEGPSMARVVSLGRGAWSGPIKDVAALLVREALR